MHSQPQQRAGFWHTPSGARVFGAISPLTEANRLLDMLSPQGLSLVQNAPLQVGSYTHSQQAEQKAGSHILYNARWCEGKLLASVSLPAIAATVQDEHAFMRHLLGMATFHPEWETGRPTFLPLARLCRNPTDFFNDPQLAKLVANCTALLLNNGKMHAAHRYPLDIAYILQISENPLFTSYVAQYASYALHQHIKYEQGISAP